MKFKYYLRGAGFGVIVSTVILSIAFLFQDNMSDAEIMRRAMELGMVMEEGSQGTLADMTPQGVTKVDMETGTDDAGESTPDTGVSSADDQTTSDTDTPDGQTGNTDTPDSQAGDGSLPNGQTDKDAGGQAAGTGSSHAGNTNTPGSEGNNNQDQNKTGSENGNNQPDSKKPDKPEEDKKEKDNNADKQSDTVTIEVVGGDVSRVVSEKLQNAGLIDDSEKFNSYMGSNGYANNIQPGTFKIKKGSSFKQIADILTSR